LIFSSISPNIPADTLDLIATQKAHLREDCAKIETQLALNKPTPANSSLVLFYDSSLLSTPLPYQESGRDTAKWLFIKSGIKFTIVGKWNINL
jgi:hypothetical protein